MKQVIVFIQFFVSAAWAGGEMGEGDKKDEGPFDDMHDDAPWQDDEPVHDDMKAPF